MFVKALRIGVSWFIRIYPDRSCVFSCLVYATSKHLTHLVRDFSYQSAHTCPATIELCKDFLQWFRNNSFRYFSSLARMWTISIRRTLEKCANAYSISENNLKPETTLAKNFSGVAAACIARTISFICSSYKSCVWLFIHLWQLLLLAVTFPVTSASCEKRFQKCNQWKHFSETPWPVKYWITMLYFQLKGYELKK